jgi:flagellar assembly protein FliH
MHQPLRKVKLAYSGLPRVTVEERDAAVLDAYRKGRQEASDELNHQILHNRREVQQLLGETLEILDAKVDRCIREMLEEIPSLVTGIASRVLAGVELDGAMVQGIVNEVIADLPSHKKQIEVFLSPRDLERFLSYLDTLDRDYPHCRFTADPHLESGDCRVESQFGSIDARVNTKLRHIQEQLAS